jgi:Tol biopolymer transport system component
VIGSTLSHFHITALLGEGGMGAVYRAEDTNLDRQVAIKVLPEEFSQNPDRLARFEREAKAVAALSHPNILALFEFGEENGVTFAVTELLDGESVGTRLEAGPMPIRKAIELARQVAEGLAAAHEHGVVHRDLKPDNLFLTRDAQHTDPGTILGTVGYMAPEQVRGEPADHRSDIFSLGVILYETLTGVRAFQAGSRIETMTAILREEPPEIDPSRHALPAGLQRILYRCLEKGPEERFQSARDLAFALESLSTTSTGIGSGVEVGPIPATGGQRSKLGSFGLAGLTLLGGLALGYLGHARLAPTPTFEPHKSRTLTFSGRDASPTVSPDGQMVAFVSDRDGQGRIWLKQLKGGGEAPLTEGEDLAPRFSPDGSSVLFGRLEGNTAAIYRTALVGGQARRLVENAFEADWSPDGTRLVLVRLDPEDPTASHVGIADARTGAETLLARIEQAVLVSPRWSPDGRQIAMTALGIAGNAAGANLLLVDASNGEQRRIAPIEPAAHLSGITWSGSGESLVYALSTNISGDGAGGLSRVVRYDLRSDSHHTLFWTQSLFPVLGGGGGLAYFDSPAAGQLIYNQLSVRQNLDLVDLSGVPGAPPRRPLTGGNARDRQPVYSPDGQTLLFSSNRSGNLDLWVLELASGEIRQITDDEANDWDPAFTPDGTTILWSSNRSGNLEIWAANRDGSQARQVSSDGFDAENPTATPDGWVVYWSSNPDKLGIWKVRLDGTEATHLHPGRFLSPDTSPDGRYASFIDNTRAQNSINILDVATGEVVPFTVNVPSSSRSSVLWGRTRWTHDGGSLAFIGADEHGLAGVYLQDFVPGQDTSSTLRPLAGFSAEFESESFAISPDGRHLALSGVRQIGSLMLAEGLPGVDTRRKQCPSPDHRSSCFCSQRLPCRRWPRTISTTNPCLLS